MSAELPETPDRRDSSLEGALDPLDALPSPHVPVWVRFLCVVLHLGHKWEAFENAREFAPHGLDTHWCDRCGHRDWRPQQL